MRLETRGVGGAVRQHGRAQAPPVILSWHTREIVCEVRAEDPNKVKGPRASPIASPD